MRLKALILGAADERAGGRAPRTPRTRSRSASTGCSTDSTRRSISALERGYYRDEGIDLTIGEGQGSVRAVQTVGAKGDMFGLADGGSVIAGVSKGRAGQGRHGGDQFLALFARGAHGFRRSRR